MTGSSAGTGAWIRRFHPAPEAPVRLVCFPHAGGSATFYFPVSRAMSPHVDVLSVQYPGRQDRRGEPCIDTVAGLADAVVEELLPWADRPLALFGHSMGASLAFEVALRLESRGVVLRGLFASGRRAPSRFRDEAVHLAGDDTLIEELKKLSGTDTQVLGDPEILRMILPAVRNDYRAAETYRFTGGPRLNCPVLALVGEEDPQVTPEEADAWQEHTNGPFRVSRFTGGHFFLNSHAAAVMSEISGHLSQTPASGHR
ncbi:surfactin synthase thioesterase subunit [Streptomyces sp. V3I8]|uniref:thioesterase II family protein n=1 Tax=Streptomyces sp. V3I8 TaxID=3042279 RepID=UPI002788F267|nr:alpha/beta fold hydrolase [Streptomyces sp. V3I8]MDQ1041731.1 surfactin synthase thioesterase subunit [Streptomyces sp. V3I8]